MVFVLFRLSWVGRDSWLPFVCRMQIRMERRQVEADWEREREEIRVFVFDFGVFFLLLYCWELG